ncbi:MAG: hypothetical protein NTV61_04005 [Candidatus Bathyarchaeota archaeon]|nr:hypothetical protein [Candidatus Bathyarchaeota archaeon]
MSLLWVAVPILVIEFAVMVSATRPRNRLIQQHEGDIRLPYKRYRQLYPNTNMSYEDYKEMQARDSYRHAISSKELKRMVH